MVATRRSSRTPCSTGTEISSSPALRDNGLGMTVEPRRTVHPPWVPADVAARLSADEFVPYNGEVALAAEALAHDLGVFIALYRAQPRARIARDHQLCQFCMATPSLCPATVRQLRAAERRYPGVLFVAYARPLQRRAV